MKFIGKTWKDEKTSLYVIELPIVEVATQGKNPTNALDMMRECIELHDPDLKFECIWTAKKSGEFALVTDDTKRMAAFILKRQREVNGLSQKDIAAALGYSSHNSIAAYETGKREPTLGKFQELLDAMGLEVELTIKPRKKVG